MSATRVHKQDLGADVANPMATPADLIVGGTAGAPARLAKGADGYVLTVDPTTHLIVWALAPGAGGGASVGSATPLVESGSAGPGNKRRLQPRGPRSPFWWRWRLRRFSPRCRARFAISMGRRVHGL